MIRIKACTTLKKKNQHRERKKSIPAFIFLRSKEVADNLSTIHPTKSTQAETKLFLEEDLQRKWSARVEKDRIPSTGTSTKRKEKQNRTKQSALMKRTGLPKWRLQDETERPHATGRTSDVVKTRDLPTTSQPAYTLPKSGFPSHVIHGSHFRICRRGGSLPWRAQLRWSRIGRSAHGRCHQLSVPMQLPLLPLRLRCSSADENIKRSGNHIIFIQVKKKERYLTQSWEPLASFKP